MQQSKNCTALHLFCLQLFALFGGNNVFGWCVGCIINPHTYTVARWHAGTLATERVCINACNKFNIRDQQKRSGNFCSAAEAAGAAYRTDVQREYAANFKMRVKLKGSEVATQTTHAK